MNYWFPVSRLRLLLPLSAVLLLATVVGCSSSKSKTPAPTPTTAATATTTSASSGAGAVTGPSAASGSSGATLSVGVGSGPLGSYLTGPNGNTLYVFLKDAPNTSNCAGGCLQTWPPLLQEEDETVKGATGVSGSFAYIDTPAGEQVTYNGAPLYYFAKDTAPGQTQGNLIGKVWFVARPDTASTALLGVGSASGKSFLVGPTGGTLYVFSKDAPGISNCIDTCLQNWPAMTVPDGIDATAVPSAKGQLAVITRDDGSKQLTYNGQPVYYYAGDKLPGDTNGDGVGGVWSIAKY